jgi:hypothetical protein
VPGLGHHVTHRPGPDRAGDHQARTVGIEAEGAPDSRAGMFNAERFTLGPLPPAAYAERGADQDETADLVRVGRDARLSEQAAPGMPQHVPGRDARVSPDGFNVVQVGGQLVPPVTARGLTGSALVEADAPEPGQHRGRRGLHVVRHSGAAMQQEQRFAVVTALLTATTAPADSTKNCVMQASWRRARPDGRAVSPRARYWPFIGCLVRARPASGADASRMCLDGCTPRLDVCGADHEVALDHRAERDAEDGQRRGNPAECRGSQHERERSQPLGKELAVGRALVGNVQPGLQSGHPARGAPHRDHDADDEGSERTRGRPGGRGMECPGEHARRTGRQSLDQAVHQPVHRRHPNVDQPDQTQQRYQGREKGKEPVVGEAGGRHAAPVADKLPARPLESIAPAGRG